MCADDCHRAKSKRMWKKVTIQIEKEEAGEVRKETRLPSNYSTFVAFHVVSTRPSLIMNKFDANVSKCS